MVSAFDLPRRSANRGRVGNSPVRRQRLPRPEWADFLCGVVADGNDEIERGSLGLGKLVPTLASQTVCRHTGSLKLRDRLWSNCARRMAPGTVGGKVWPPLVVH